MQYKASWFLKILLTNQHPFCWSVFAQKKNSLSKRAKSNVTSMNRSFSDEIILIMRRSMELNAVSMMSCRLRFPKVGNGQESKAVWMFEMELMIRPNMSNMAFHLLQAKTSLTAILIFQLQNLFLLKIIYQLNNARKLMMATSCLL